MSNETAPDAARAAAGRALAAFRQRYRKVCALPGCGVEFEGTVRRMYCSNAHASRAVKLRRKAQRTTASAEPA